ncbi:MAG: hypothetical protein GX946_08060 [Oligosphaeraceae bacterium]|nr:hypothetical protein [Oligosphaeraceae bacterium]
MTKACIHYTISVNFLCALFLALFLPVSQADPVEVRRSTMNLTTCAFSEAEMRRLFEFIFQKRHQTQGRALSFAQTPKIEEIPALNAKNRLSAYWHWQSELLLDESEAGKYLFSCSQEEQPWAVYLNGKAIGGWQSEAELHALPVGVYRLQFIAVQKLGAEIPRLRIFRKVAGGLRECQPNLQAPSAPKFTRLPKKAERLSDCLTAWKQIEIFHFLDTDQYLAYCRKPEQNVLPEGTCFYVDATGERQELPLSGELLLSAAQGLQIEWEKDGQTLVLPALAQWPLAKPLQMHLLLRQHSLLLAASEPLTVQLAAPWHNELPQELQAHWQLHCRQYGRNGELLYYEILPQQYAESLSFQLRLAANCRNLSLSGEIAGLPLAKALEIAVLRPQDFNSELIFNGKYLLSQGKTAVLRCDPLKPAELPPSKKISAPIKLAYFDDGLGDTQAIDTIEQHSAAPCCSFKQCEDYRLVRINLPQLPGTEAQIPSLAALQAMLAQKPHMVLLNLGEAELRAGQDALSWSKQLLYMTQTCLAAQIMPLIVTLPEMPGIKQELVRQSALLSKELALNMNLPVADLYSMRILEEQDSHAWLQSRGLQHRSASMEGRNWMQQQMLMALPMKKR